MRANLVIAVLLGVAVTAAACNDTTAPTPTPRLATIANISVAGHGGYTDTVKVSFNYYTASCDTGVVVKVGQVNEGLRFTVTSWPTNRPCPLTETFAMVVPPAVGYLVNPPHPSPLRLIFTQPEGTDSVRVVAP